MGLSPMTLDTTMNFLSIKPMVFRISMKEMGSV